MWRQHGAAACPEKRKHGEDHVAEAFEPAELVSVTLADLIPNSMGLVFKEEDDMQPVVTDLIQAVMHAVKCDCMLKDTHLASNQLENPVSRPGCTLVATGLKAEWTQIVSVWEFRMGTGETETETMYCQQVERCRAVLESYSERQLVVAVNVTMHTLEVMTAERQPSDDLRLSTSGCQPFSISKDSPGFQLLVQLLLTPKATLGFATPVIPAIESLGQHCFEVQYYINQGSALQGSGSWVFVIKLKAAGDAILKLNRGSQEVNKPPITMRTRAWLAPVCFAFM